MLAAALRDSAAVVAIVTCITQASFLMMHCIIPKWNSVETIDPINITTGNTCNIIGIR